MNKLLLLLVFVSIFISTFAQSPEKMSYQAVIRDSESNLVTNQTIAMQISLIQGSVNGTIVYLETHNPLVNENGLVTIEIGSGTSLFDFSVIDWANGPFFIKTETDLNNGTTYTIAGTSQLLSVPFAFFANTAGNTFSGNYNDLFNSPDLTDFDQDVTDDFDGEYNSLEGVPTNLSEFTNDLGYITGFSELDGDTTNEIQDLQLLDNILTITNNGSSTEIDLSVFLDNTDTQLTEEQVDEFVANNNYLLIEQDGSITNEIELPTSANEGDMVYWNGDDWVIIPTTLNEGATLQMISGVPTWVGGIPPVINIGDYRDGGVVFYVDETGVHGLVCDINDLSDNAEWGCFGTQVPGASFNEVGTGAQNTIEIEAACATVGTAADLCANLIHNNYEDWFLPSKDELELMLINKDSIDSTSIANGGVAFESSRYWSSSEYSYNGAWGYSLGSGNVFLGDRSYLYNVRAVRAF